MSRFRWWWTCLTTVHLVREQRSPHIVGIFLTQRAAMKARDKYQAGVAHAPEIIRLKVGQK